MILVVPSVDSASVEGKFIMESEGDKVQLDPVEVRVLGALIEKHLSTPDYYPLSLNGLVNACNQISNRDPVVSYTETEVSDAVERLKELRLVRTVFGSESRVPKFKHLVDEHFRLSLKEIAVLCVMMLRGPQTIGEVRGRTGRMYEFSGLGEVEKAITVLETREAGPLIVKLPRQQGQKEARYAHLLSGEIDPEKYKETSAPANANVDKISRLEAEISTLREEIAAIRAEFSEFRKQFD